METLADFARRVVKRGAAHLIASTAWRFAMMPILAKVLRIGCAVAAAALLLCPAISHADESGISFWLPGLEGSLAAVPTTPGWSIAAIYYHTSVNASGAAAAAREFQVGRFSPNVNINLNVNLSGQADLMFIAPTYTFATPVFGGQLSATMAGVFGDRKSTRLNSSHSQISYAVFCLKKKKINKDATTPQEIKRKRRART